MTAARVARFLARLANLPKGLYILPIFIFIFLMVDFLTPVSQTLVDRSSPEFHDW